MRAEVVLFVSLTALGTAGVTLAADAGPAAPTPFASTRPGEILVPVTVGARGPFRFLLDTGSTHTAVTERLATAVDAVPVARTVMRAAAGSVGCLVVALPTVVVDGVSADGLTATALPPAAAAALGPGVDGVLGQDFLSRFSLHDRLSALADRLARRRLRRARDTPGAGARPGSLAGRTAAAGDDAGGAPTLRRFVPDSGADTLVLFGERRAGCLITAWRAGTSALGIADRRAGGADGDRRRTARRRGHARSPGRGGRAVDRAPTIRTACCRCTCSPACSSARGAARW